jgi:hypothetical protein
MRMDRPKPYRTGQRFAFRWDASSREQDVAAVLSEAHERRYAVERDESGKRWLVDTGPLFKEEEE